MRIAQGRFVEAQVDAQRAFDLLSRVLPAGHFATEVARCRIGISIMGQGKKREAKPFIQSAYSGLKASKIPLPDRYLLPCKAAAAKFSS